MRGTRKSSLKYDVVSVDRKKCKECGLVLDSSEYGISYVFTRKSDNLRVACLHSRCKKCQADALHKRWMGSERKAELVKRMESINSDTKICNRCGRELDKSFFNPAYKSFRRKDGKTISYLRSYCKECTKEYNSEVWFKNKNRLTSKKNLAKNRRVRKEKFFQYRALSFRHHYKCTEIDGKKLALFLWKLWHKQKGLCALSGRKLTKENAQIDHIEPRKNGTNNDFDNLQWTTKDANHAKNQMTQKEFKQFIIDIYNNICL